MPKQGKLWISQNFLTDGATIKRIVNLAGLGPSDHVIEIGPGKGHTTQELAKRCGQVTAVELDVGLSHRLREKFGGSRNVRIINDDFLKYSLPKDKCFRVFSNIPFSITTALVRKLTSCQNPAGQMWLVMEKGAAKRFMGKPFEFLDSLLLKPRFDLNIAYYFRREDFHPKPSVDAVLLHFSKKEQSDIPQCQYEQYREFISQSRRFGLKKVFTGKQLKRALKEAGIIRPVLKEIRYVQWLCLFRCYLQCGGKSHKQ